jgi:hypothetical protein
MDHELPDDTAVIEWSTSGGLADPGGGSPDLVVHPDGRVEVGERFAGGKATSGRIAPSELQSLLQVALEEHRFFELDGEQMEAAVAEARRRRADAAAAADAVTAVPLGPPYADAGTSRIAIAADGKRHEVSGHALHAAAREYPEVAALADLRAIEVRLLALAERVAGDG